MPRGLIVSRTTTFNPFSAKRRQGQNSTKIPKFRFVKFWKQIALFESRSREVSFEWSHHGILSTDSKTRTTLRDSNIHSGSERVNIGISLEASLQGSSSILIRMVFTWRTLAFTAAKTESSWISLLNANLSSYKNNWTNWAFKTKYNK